MQCYHNLVTPNIDFDTYTWRAARRSYIMRRVGETHAYIWAYILVSARVFGASVASLRVRVCCAARTTTWREHAHQTRISLHTRGARNHSNVRSIHARPSYVRRARQIHAPTHYPDENSRSPCACVLRDAIWDAYRVLQNSDTPVRLHSQEKQCRFCHHYEPKVTGGISEKYNFNERRRLYLDEI